MIWKRVALHFYHWKIFIMVLINTRTTGKLNLSTVPPSLFNESSDFHTVFFCASHKSKRMEKNQCILSFIRTISHFQGQFYKIPGQFQDKWHYFQIPGVFQDQGQIQGLFQVCVNPCPSKQLRHIIYRSFLTYQSVAGSDLLTRKAPKKQTTKLRLQNVEKLLIETVLC